jgi:hypothetical protein
VRRVTKKVAPSTGRAKVGKLKLTGPKLRANVRPVPKRGDSMLPYLENPKDARRSARSKVRITARYVSDNLVADGVVTDISADGLFFCSDYLDGTGEPARLWLEIPWRNRPLELRGEVRWVSDTPRTGGMGIRFIDVALEDRMVLSSLGLADLVDSAYSPPGGDA